MLFAIFACSGNFAIMQASQAKVRERPAEEQAREGSYFEHCFKHYTYFPSEYVPNTNYDVAGLIERYKPANVGDKANEHIFVVQGDPGNGKTELAKFIACKTGRPMARVSAAVLNLEDYIKLLVAAKKQKDAIVCIEDMHFLPRVFKKKKLIENGEASTEVGCICRGQQNVEDCKENPYGFCNTERVETTRKIWQIMRDIGSKHLLLLTTNRKNLPNDLAPLLVPLLKKHRGNLIVLNASDRYHGVSSYRDLVRHECDQRFPVTPQCQFRENHLPVGEEAYSKYELAVRQEIYSTCFRVPSELGARGKKVTLDSLMRIVGSLDFHEYGCAYFAKRERLGRDQTQTDSLLRAFLNLFIELAPDWDERDFVSATRQAQALFYERLSLGRLDRTKEKEAYGEAFLYYLPITYLLEAFCLSDGNVLFDELRRKFIFRYLWMAFSSAELPHDTLDILIRESDGFFGADCYDMIESTREFLTARFWMLGEEDKKRWLDLNQSTVAEGIITALVVNSRTKRLDHKNRERALRYYDDVHDFPSVDEWPDKEAAKALMRELREAFTTVAGLRRIHNIARAYDQGVCGYLVAQNRLIEDRKTREDFIEAIEKIHDMGGIEKTLTKDLAKKVKCLTPSEIAILFGLASSSGSYARGNPQGYRVGWQFTREDFPLSGFVSRENELCHDSRILFAKTLGYESMRSLLSADGMRGFTDRILKRVLIDKSNVAQIEELVKNVVDSTHERYGDYGDLRDFLSHRQFVQSLLQGLLVNEDDGWHNLRSDDIDLLVQMTERCTTGEIVCLFRTALRYAKQKQHNTPCIELCDFYESACELSGPPFEVAFNMLPLESKGEEISNTIAARKAKFYLYNTQSLLKELPGPIQGLINVLASPGYYNQYLTTPCRTNLLLHGPPGTGKSHLVKVIAALTGIPLRQVTGADFINGFQGSGVKSVDELFISASKLDQSVIIFIDEIDGLAASQNQAESNGEAKRANIKLMDWLNSNRMGQKICIILATNFPDKLPSNLLSRFEVVPLGIPGDHEREAILRYGCSRIKHAMNDVEFKDLANKTAGVSWRLLEETVSKAVRSVVPLGCGPMGLLCASDVLKAFYELRASSYEENPQTVIGVLDDRIAYLNYVFRADRKELSSCPQRLAEMCGSLTAKQLKEVANEAMRLARAYECAVEDYCLMAAYDDIAAGDLWENRKKVIQILLGKDFSNIESNNEAIDIFAHEALGLKFADIEKIVELAKWTQLEAKSSALTPHHLYVGIYTYLYDTSKKFGEWVKKSSVYYGKALKKLCADCQKKFADPVKEDLKKLEGRKNEWVAPYVVGAVSIFFNPLAGGAICVGSIRNDIKLREEILKLKKDLEQIECRCGVVEEYVIKGHDPFLKYEPAKALLLHYIKIENLGDGTVSAFAANHNKCLTVPAIRYLVEYCNTNSGSTTFGRLNKTFEDLYTCVAISGIPNKASVGSTN